MSMSPVGAVWKDTAVIWQGVTFLQSFYLWLKNSRNCAYEIQILSAASNSETDNDASARQDMEPAKLVKS